MQQRNPDTACTGDTSIQHLTLHTCARTGSSSHQASSAEPAVLPPCWQARQSSSMATHLCLGEILHGSRAAAPRARSGTVCEQFNRLCNAKVFVIGMRRCVVTYQQ